MVGTKCFPNRIDWVLKLRGIQNAGGVSYKGVWNATTNTPSIPVATDGSNAPGGNRCAAAGGNKGWYYV